jgi:hypothetical protein
MKVEHMEKRKKMGHDKVGHNFGEPDWHNKMLDEFGGNQREHGKGLGPEGWKGKNEEKEQKGVKSSAGELHFWV